jgi:hypothetical protein
MFDAASRGGDTWDSRDFRLNDLAWRYWPREQQYDTRIRVLTGIASVARQHGGELFLTGDSGCAAVVFGRLIEAPFDVVEFRVRPRHAPDAGATARILADAGCRPVAQDDGGSYFENSLRVVRVERRSRQGAVWRRRIARDSGCGIALYAAASPGDLTRFLVRRAAAEGARLFRAVMSGRLTARVGEALGVPRRVRKRRIDLEEFLSLNLLDDNELNTLVRMPHFDLITANGRLRTVGDVVEFLKHGDNLAALVTGARDPVAVTLSRYPRHLDRRFWENGNSFFLNCVRYGFRSGVPAYHLIDSMLDEHGEVLYSSSYYSRRPEMPDADIEALLRDNPIEIQERSVASGRHRVCAMIGRLISGRAYLAFWAEY